MSVSYCVLAVYMNGNAIPKKDVQGKGFLQVLKHWTLSSGLGQVSEKNATQKECILSATIVSELRFLGACVRGLTAQESRDSQAHHQVLALRLPSSLPQSLQDRCMGNPATLTCYFLMISPP